MDQSLANLAPHSRIWVFQADRFLNQDEQLAIRNKLNEFIPQWASHGNDLYGGFSLENNLFVAIGVDEAKSPASGCSIDSLTRIVKDLGTQLHVDFFNRMAIAYESNGQIELVSMSDFKRLITDGKVNENTIVFNNLVNTKAEFDTKWRTSVKNSWHTNLFQLV
jgi:hypothetical protein